jgi:hypothetical protein
VCLQSFALGTMVKVGPDHTDNDGLDMDAAAGSAAAAAASNGAAAAAAAVAAGRQGYSSAGLGWVARWFKQQRGVTRYNCADSLDRTNVGSFFGAVQVGALCACRRAMVCHGDVACLLCRRLALYCGRGQRRRVCICKLCAVLELHGTGL